MYIFLFISFVAGQGGQSEWAAQNAPQNQPIPNGVDADYVDNSQVQSRRYGDLKNIARQLITGQNTMGSQGGII